MKMVMKMTVAWVFLCLMALPGHAAPEDSVYRAGNVLFKIPTGWQRVDKNNLLLLVPPDMTPEQRFVIAIIPGQELKGDFRAWFDTTLREGLAQGERIVQSTPVQSQRTPAGVDTLYTAVAIEDGSHTRTFRVYLAAHPGNRVEMIACLASSESLFKRYESAVTEFVQNWNFANLGSSTADPSNPHRESPAARNNDTPRAQAPTGGVGLDGLYVGTENRQQFNMLTHLYDFKVFQVYYLFLPDGRVYFGLPPAGALDRFDFARAQRDDPKNCGTYRVSSDKIQFTRNGVPDNQPAVFERGTDSLRIGRTWVHRVAKAEGLRLDGTFGRQNFVNTSVAGAGVQGGVSGDKKITFSRDGRFSQTGFTGFAGVRDTPSSYSGAATSSQTSSSGTCTLRGYTLELNYTDGRREQHTFFLYPKEENQVVVIDGVSYTRR